MKKLISSATLVLALLTGSTVMVNAASCGCKVCKCNPCNCG